MKNIKRKINKIFLNKFITLGLLPILLIAFWFISSLFLNNKISFSVLLYKHSQSDIRQVSAEKLLKGNRIAGEFRAKDNYLGIVMLRFDEYVKPDSSGEDILAFRLKEKGSKDWYYFNNYRSGLLKNNLLFPFGFPVIEDSKDKIYEFEIESLLGNETNAAQVNKNNFNLFTGYQFPLVETFSDSKATLNFLINKSITSFTNIEFLMSSVLYLLPLIIYILIYVLSPWWKRIENFGYLLSGVFLFFIFLDIFLIKEVYLGVLTFLILGWIYCIVKNKFGSKINFFFVFMLILLWILLIGLDIKEFQNKINIWVYTFLVIGIGKSIFEERRSTKK